MSNLEEPGFGEAGEPRVAHHLGFDKALDRAVDDWAAKRGAATAPGETVELQVTLMVKVSKTNPGRIEGYSAKIG
jgi:hypothetical protein